MCLTNSVKITPHKDIVCYKVFCVNRKVLDSDLLSPNKMKKWKLGRTETLRRNDAVRFKSRYENREYVVEGGAYHSYQTLNDVSATYFVNPRYVICKCIIPKNSKYIYSGLNNRNEESRGYASQKLKPIEFVQVDRVKLFEQKFYGYPAPTTSNNNIEIY